jgi:hypothetical protein
VRVRARRLHDRGGIGRRIGGGPSEPIIVAQQVRRWERWHGRFVLFGSYTNGVTRRFEDVRNSRGRSTFSYDDVM